MTVERNRIHVGDCLQVLRGLPPGFAQTCITSPPYWGLRDYGIHADAGAIGLEPTMDQHLDNLVRVFREVRRVLRPDGTLWLNYGDAYATQGGNGGQGATGQRAGRSNVEAQNHRGARKAPAGFKPKDLMGLPWRVAFALQDDGWWLRSDIVWHKPNPMPESVTDRPTRAHEYVFLLSPSADYFYDAEAIKEKASENTHTRGKGINPKAKFTGAGAKLGDSDEVRLGRNGSDKQAGHGRRHAGPTLVEAGVASTMPRPSQNESFQAATSGAVVPYRNKRSVWTIPTQPTSEAHFATFPEALVEPCIKAGTGQEGACPTCGAPMERIVEKGDPLDEWRVACGANDAGGWDGTTRHPDERAKAKAPDQAKVKANILAGMRERKTKGWRPTCKCPLAAPVPCIVLDPFFGSGTTGLTAKRLGRDFVGIELNPEYAAIAARRLSPAMNHRLPEELG